MQVNVLMFYFSLKVLNKMCGEKTQDEFSADDNQEDNILRNFNYGNTRLGIKHSPCIIVMIPSLA